MFINLQSQPYQTGSTSTSQKRKIYLRDPNVVDASTSHLNIPDVVDFRPPRQEDNSNHLKKSLLIGLASVPVLFMGGYFGAIRAAERKFFVDAAQKSKTQFKPILESLSSKISKVTIKTEDNLDLKCWDINPHGFNRYVVVCHGNSQNLNECQEIYDNLHNKGYGVFALEYRGYAENPGRITEEGLYKDGEAAMTYLHAKGIPDNKIGLVGYSLGGAVATDIASKHDVGFVVLMSTFNNAKDLTKNAVNYLNLDLPQSAKNLIDKIPNPLIPLGNSYQSDEKISKIRCPITFIHSKDDKAIPITLAQKLAEKAKSTVQKSFITLQSGDHWFDKYKYKAISDAVDKFSL